MPFYLLWTILHFLSFFLPSGALTIFPPESPVYLGTTIRITWTFGPQDPPVFDILARCEGTFETPGINATTSAGRLFIRLPSFLNFGVSIPCEILGKVHKADQLLAQSKPFDLILQDPSNVQSIDPATSFKFVTSTRRSASPSPSPTSLSTVAASQNSTGKTVDLSSILLPTPTKKQISVAFSTVAPSSTTSDPSTISSSVESSINTDEATPSPKKKPSLAIIIGPSVGGFVFICALIVFLLVCRHRRKRSPSLEVVAYEGTPTTPSAPYGSPGNSSGIDVRGSRPRSDVPSTTDLLAADEGTIGEPRLREMVQLMSERIMALEAQQRASRIVTGEVLNEGEVMTYEDQLRPPPGYSQAGGEAPLSQPRPPSLIATPADEEPLRH